MAGDGCDMRKKSNYTIENRISHLQSELRQYAAGRLPRPSHDWKEFQTERVWHAKYLVIIALIRHFQTHHYAGGIHDLAIQ